MKTFKIVFLSIAMVLLMVSCVKTVKFPVSTVIPAAEISADFSKDKNNNTVISVTANNMASADRLAPPKKTYVVWIKTSDNGVKNIGQLSSKNAKKASLKTVTSYEPQEIFITAEDEGDVSYPAGIEISRAVRSR